MRRATTLLSIAAAAIQAFAADPPKVREYEERCANYYARQYGVSAALVRAVIQVESAWQPGTDTCFPNRRWSSEYADRNSQYAP